MENALRTLKRKIIEIEAVFDEIKEMADEREKKMREKGESNPVEEENIRTIREGLARSEEEIRKLRNSLPVEN